MRLDLQPKTDILNINLTPIGNPDVESVMQALELSQSQIEDIRESIEGSASFSDWRDCTRSAAAVRIAYPDIFDSLQLTAKQQQSIIDFLGINDMAGTKFAATSNMILCLILFPEKARQVLIAKFGEATLTDCSNISNEYDLSLTQLCFIRLIAPDFAIPTEVLQKVWQQVENLSYHFDFYKLLQYWAYAKIIFPNRINIGWLSRLEPFYRDGLLDFIPNQKRTNISFFPWYAFAVKVILADTVKIDETGLHIALPTQFVPPSVPLPSSLSFDT